MKMQMTKRTSIYLHIISLFLVISTLYSYNLRLFDISLFKRLSNTKIYSSPTKIKPEDVQASYKNLVDYLEKSSSLGAVRFVLVGNGAILETVGKIMIIHTIYFLSFKLP